MLDDQSAFEQAMRHLFEQGKPCRGEDGYCAYRGPYNTKCAVGALIPDDQYSPLFEGEDMDHLKGAVPNLHKVSKHLLLRLQALHDTNLNWGKSGFTGFEAAMKIATDFRLDASILSTLRENQ
jgi:hypothetical protein